MLMAKDKKTEESDEVKETDTSSEDTTKENSSSTEEKVDYEAIATAEAERANAAEKKASELAYKLRETKREGTEEVIDEEDKPITTKDLKRVEQTLLKQSQETNALAIARANTSSEAEAQAALVFWRNRVVPTGNLQEDIEFAIAGMNRKRIQATSEEIARADASRDMVRSDSAGTQRDGMGGTEPKLPSNSPLKGYKYMGNNTYTKKLASGKTLFVNTRPVPGQPKSWVE